MSSGSDAGAVQPSCDGALDEEAQLMADPRLRHAIELFNAGDWYACHDGFEELWHETQGSVRTVLQGILQIAVGQLHLERGNLHGATVLTGEGLGRLRRCDNQALGLDLVTFRQEIVLWLQALQAETDTSVLPRPTLHKPGGSSR